MSFPPHAPARPRESVFISGPLPQENEPVSSPYIEACVAVMQKTCEKIHDAQYSLHRGVADLRRMSTVLENERLFALVNEGHVALYQAQLAEEIEPQITDLAEHAEKGVNHLERNEKVIKSKLESVRAHTSSRASSGTPVDLKKLEVLVRQRQALEKEAQDLVYYINDLEGRLMDPT